jgi:hypothetical protein
MPAGFIQPSARRKLSPIRKVLVSGGRWGATIIYAEANPVEKFLEAIDKFVKRGYSNG